MSAGAAIVVAGVLGAALFACADAAVTSIPEARVRALVAVGDGNSSLRRFVDDPSRVLARLLVGRSLCIIMAAATAAWLLMPRMPRWGLIIAVVVVTTVYTVVAEVVTTVARTRATSLAPVLLAVTYPLELALVPLVGPLLFVGRSVASLVSRPDQDDPVASARLAEAEVEYLIQKGKETGNLDQAELLAKAVDFRETVASQVMVPRTKMVALPLRTPLGRVLELITIEGHSRYPIYDKRTDDIVGLLYVKDIFRILREGRIESTNLATLVRRPVLYVQEGQKVDTILREMRQRRLHMAIVVDEFGGTSGLVTLEDILELLVGDIQDELDEEEKIEELGEGRLLVDASLPVERLSSRLNVEMPSQAAFVSVGGMIMEQLGRVPEAGTSVRVGDLELVVREADERRVRRIEVVAHPQSSHVPPT